MKLFTKASMAVLSILALGAATGSVECAGMKNKGMNQNKAGKQKIERVNALFERFVNLQKNPNLSTECFADKLIDILGEDPKFEGLVRDLEDHRTDSASTFGKVLIAHKDLLPEETKTLVKQYSAFQLLDILSKRSKLNGKKACK